MPALVLVLVATIVVGWSVLLPADYRRLGASTIASVAFVPNLLLLFEGGYFDADADSKPLLHLWSLGVEEQFYILWPLLAIWFGRSRYFPLVIGLVIGLSLLLCLWVSSVNQDAAYYLPFTRFWEPAAGCLLALLPKVRKGATSDVLSVVAALGLVASVFVVSKEGFPGYSALLPVGATALLIACGPASIVNAKLLARGPIVWVGKISYPLYLWHWPLLVYTWIIWGKHIAPSTLLSVLGVALVLAAVTHHWGELRLRRSLSTPRLAFGGAAAAMVVGVFAFGIYHTDGVLARYPVEIRQVLAFQNYEFAKDARYPACWLSDDAPFSSATAECAPGADKPAARLAIWGDSHAARLYPGLRDVAGGNVAQFTRNACPPILDLPALGCRLGNNAVMEAIRLNPPEHVVMFAAWFNHTGWLDRAPLVNQLDRTIRELQNAGVSRVTLVGSAPNYPKGLPSQIFEYWRHVGKLPDRLPGDPTGQLALIDEKIAGVARQRQVGYVSIFAILCNTAECVTHTPASRSDLMTWDYGHLTTNGAVWFAKRLAGLGIIEPTKVPEP